MRVLFCGGGTAGHITPALAIAEEIKISIPNSHFLFVGRENGNENKIIVKEGHPLKTIKIQGLKRKISTENIKSLVYTLKAINDAKRIINEFKPDVVVGTGGYVCLPVIVAARQMKIQTVLHESNVSPGLTTKLLANHVNVVMLGYAGAKGHLSRKANCVVVGNPIRKDFYRITRESARRKLGLGEDEIFIISFGGSLGAGKMNEVILEVMENFSSKENNVRHIHGTGDKYYEEIKKKHHFSEDSGCRIMPYINNLPTMMKAADIAICRCGAVTLSEISESGVASILIPSPNVSDNHQYKNGRFFSDNKAAYLIEEEKLEAVELEKSLKRLKNDKIERKSVAKCAKRLSGENSSKTVVKVLKSLVFES